MVVFVKHRTERSRVAMSICWSVCFCLSCCFEFLSSDEIRFHFKLLVELGDREEKSLCCYLLSVSPFKICVGRFGFTLDRAIPNEFSGFSLRIRTPLQNDNSAPFPVARS